METDKQVDLDQVITDAQLSAISDKLDAAIKEVTGFENVQYLLHVTKGRDDSALRAHATGKSQVDYIRNAIYSLMEDGRARGGEAFAINVLDRIKVGISLAVRAALGQAKKPEMGSFN